MRQLTIWAAFCALLATNLPAHAKDGPDAALDAWAEAFASQDGTRAAALYTEDARLWGTVSREQSVGQAAIIRYFGPMPGVTARSVAFADYALRDLGNGAAVASGQYTFTLHRADGSELRPAARFSMTLLRGPDGTWRIVDHHSSLLPRPPS